MVRERSLEGALDQLNARIGLKIDCRVALKKMESFVCTSTRALPRPARQLRVLLGIFWVIASWC